MKVGWIGLGNMGVPMIRNIAQAGIDVIAYNRTQKTLSIDGVQLVTSLGDAVRDRDVVVLMVSDVAAVRDVLFAQGAAQQMGSGTLVVNMSTIGVDETLEIAKDLHSRGLRFVDAPVLGSVKPAENGALTVVAGGDASDFELLKPLFDAVAKAAFHIGPCGKGATMKLLVNAYLGVAVEALGECLTFGAENGLATKLMLDVLQNSAVWSPMIAGKRDMLLQQAYDAQFALRHLTKDLGLAIRQASSIGAHMPAVDATLDTLCAAVETGLGNRDMVAVVEYLKAQTRP
ncbi:NAD(P)-dependent oxidoreductase [Alicyclobacillus fastidiosus]|uniref:NAD(P)-dependent oxidoreductase n=1 Tax=Alicyclobacillus fastidiosus TaxID=392011 RepID=A0ABY6ZMY9_9BACL|nr:NAD(P)-dependent oxidoreductase [Alicyclobacillus fastidiosus]WAH44200.1 NAD(P)-dependent oxidoreductase [Alicyclobacillus fastidiosus]GMA60516.1 3-hydroxy acid dehydrogenase [Alicyclobacillus fastidiosus]